MHRIQCNVWCDVNQSRSNPFTIQDSSLFFLFLLLNEMLIQCCCVYCETTREKIGIIVENVQCYASGKLKGQHSAAFERFSYMLFGRFFVIDASEIEFDEILCSIFILRSFVLFRSGFISLFTFWFVKCVLWFTLLVFAVVESLYFHNYNPKKLNLILTQTKLSCKSYVYALFVNFR